MVSVDAKHHGRRTATSIFTRDFHKLPGELEFDFSVAFAQRTHGLLGWPPGLSHTHLPSSDLNRVQCCFTSTETLQTFGDGEPTTATSTFTQLLNSETLNFQFSVALRPQRPYTH